MFTEMFCRLLREAWSTGIQPVGWLGVTLDQLRNWDRSGLITVPPDPVRGYRAYSAAEIGRLRVIRMLRQFDAGERERLRDPLDTPGDYEDIETLADRWLSTLQQQEQRAQAIIHHLTVMIEMEAAC
jgi:DNA-binding transcriptional MerR regulator